MCVGGMRACMHKCTSINIIMHLMYKHSCSLYVLVVKARKKFTITNQAGFSGDLVNAFSMATRYRYTQDKIKIHIWHSVAPPCFSFTNKWLFFPLYKSYQLDGQLNRWTAEPIDSHNNNKWTLLKLTRWLTVITLMIKHTNFIKIYLLK